MTRRWRWLGGSLRPLACRGLVSGRWLAGSVGGSTAGGVNVSACGLPQIGTEPVHPTSAKEQKRKQPEFCLVIRV
jgi:hypothetical protein